MLRALQLTESYKYSNYLYDNLLAQQLLVSSAY